MEEKYSQTETVKRAVKRGGQTRNKRRRKIALLFLMESRCKLALA
jgi:hypothetical protein